MSDASENAPSSSDTTTLTAETCSTLEEVVKSIFSSCDDDDSGSVLTSKLITYITPFMSSNMCELMQLKTMLDPTDEDISVTQERFYSVVSEWAGRINAAVDDEKFHEANPRDFDLEIEEKQSPFTHSTPRLSFELNLLRGSGITNVSSPSLCSESITAALDKTVFEEQMRELVHHNRKLTEELTIAKLQLTASEEQIENLQTDLEKVVRRLTSEQQVNELLQRNIKEVDDCKENTSVPLVMYEDLKKQKACLEKDISSLKEQLCLLDNEKVDLQQQIDENLKRDCELKQQLLDLHKEVELREEKLSTMEDMNNGLKSELEEQQRIKDDYKKRSEELLAEKQFLEKILHRQQLQQNLSTTTTLNRSCHFRSSCCSPGNFSHSPTNLIQNISPSSTSSTAYNSRFERIRQGEAIFHSPKLMKQLDNPVFPINFNSANKKISDDSPDLMPAVKSSTPKELGTVQLKYALDDSIPAEIRDIPVLWPSLCADKEKAISKNSNKSLPSMYIIECPEETSTEKNLSAHQAQNSSDEDYWKYNVVQVVQKQSPHETLHAEISEVSGSCADGKECPHLIHLMERNHAFLNLQYELLEHENCSYIIEKQQADIEKLKQHEEDYQQNIELLSFKINELNCELNANNAKNEQNTHTTYVTELKWNVEQHDAILNDFKEKLETVEKEKRDLLTRVNILEQDKKSLVKLMEYYQEKSKDQDVLRSELEEASKLLDELKTNFQVLASENCSLKENVCALENSIKFVSSSKVKVLKEQDKLMQINENLKLDRHKVEKELENVTFNYEQLELVLRRNKIETEEKVVELEKRIKLTESGITGKDEIITKLEKDISNEIDLRILMKRSHEKEITIKNHEIEQLSNNLKNQKDINNNLIRNLSLLEDEIKNKNNIISELQIIKKNELDFYNQNTNVLKDINTKLQNKISEKEKEYELLKNQYAELDTKNSILSKEMNELQEECKSCKNCSSYVVLMEEIEHIRKENADIEAKLKSVEAEKLALLEQKENDADLLKALHSKSISARVAVEKLERKKNVDDTELRDKIQNLESSNEQLNTENDRLNNENSKFKDKLEQFDKEKQEWDTQKAELLLKIAEYLFEIADLRQKLEKNETSSEVSDASTSCSFYDETNKEGKHKEMLSYSKMRLKVDKLQGKLENVQELLENEKKKSEELQLKVCELNGLKACLENMKLEFEKLLNEKTELVAENERLKSTVSDLSGRNGNDVDNIECNDFKLKLAQSKQMLEKAEREILRLKAEHTDMSELEIAITNSVSDINDLRLLLHESNVRLVSLLEEIAASGLDCSQKGMQGPHNLVLSSWYSSIKKHTVYSHLESAEPATNVVQDTMKVLVERTANLKEMVIFNRRFSDSLKDLAQDNTYCVSSTDMPPQSFTIDQGLVHRRFTLKPSTLLLRPVSPDSPSLVNIVESATCDDAIEPKGSKCNLSNDSSGSSMSLESLSQSSNKDDDVQTLHSAFEEISLRSAFPNLPGPLLEYLTLNQDSSLWEKMSNKEVEEKYGILMTAFTTDGSSIKLRFENQKTYLMEMKNCFLAELRKLEENYTMKKIEDITQAFSLACVSAITFGAVREELKVHRCIQLIRSYVANLNRRLDDQNQYQSTRIITRPIQRKTNSKSIKIIVHKYFDNGAKPFALSDAVRNFTKQKTAAELVVCKPSTRELMKRPGRSVWNCFFYGVCIMVIFVLFIIFGNCLTEIVFSGEDVKRFLYPLKHLSWSELSAPFSKKIYCLKGCPH